MALIALLLIVRLFAPSLRTPLVRLTILMIVALACKLLIPPPESVIF